MSLSVCDGFQPGVPIQWWYWHGYLQEEGGHKYSFSLVFFAGDFIADRVGMQMIHAGITDLQSGQFASTVRYVPWLPPAHEGAFALR